MGEYEPHDSRNVTLKQGDEPGGLKRTGPREDQARSKGEQAEREEKDDNTTDKHNKGKPMPEQQQRQKQSQSQSQGRALHPEHPEDSALAGNQKQAIDNPVGAAEPQYDQYELNQPSNLARYGVRRPDEQAEEADVGGRQNQPQADSRKSEQAAAQSDTRAAYGDDVTARDEIEAVEGKDHDAPGG